MIKFIATDMDGTLLNSKKELSPEFYDVFEELKKRNILFAAASGRQYYTLAKEFNDIKDDMLFIAENEKFYTDGICEFAKCEDIDFIISDKKPNEEILKLLKERNISIIY